MKKLIFFSVLAIISFGFPLKGMAEDNPFNDPLGLGECKEVAKEVGCLSGDEPDYYKMCKEKDGRRYWCGTGGEVLADCLVQVPCPPPPCDCNKDGTCDISDVIMLLNYLFRGGAAPTGQCDANKDGTLDVSDAATILNYLFHGSGSGGGVGQEEIYSTLVATPSIVKRGQKVTVTWGLSEGGKASSSDWIGLFKAGDSNYNYINFKYTNGQVSGYVVFTIPTSLPVGTYEFRYLLNNGYTSVAKSNSVKVE